MKKNVSTFTISLLALCNSFFGDMLELNVDNFEQTVKSLKKPLVVEVYSTRCSHCKHMAPIYEELSLKYQSKIQFAKINISQSQGLENRWAVLGVPAFLFFDTKQTTPSAKYIGSMTKEELEENLLEFLGEK